MCEVKEIFDKTVELLKYKNKFLAGKKILVTSGGTREYIDPVRYISNCSSGKMGNAIAEIANFLGAKVTLVTTSIQQFCTDINVVRVDSAIEMFNEVEKYFEIADVLIMVAAVSDYRVKNKYSEKIKKTEKNDELTLELVKNPDILFEMCEKKRPEQIVIGFCAETEDLLNNAKEKIKKKKCDYIVANDVSKKDIGFNQDENEIFIIDKNLNVEKFNKDTKENIALKLLEFVFNEQK